MAVAPARGFSLSAAAGGAPLLFRQLFDADTGTFTYLIAEVASAEGLMIDPVFEQHDRDLSLIQELGIQLVACLDTHAHADHVTGSWLMHDATGSAIGLAAVAGAENVTLPLRHGDQVAFGSRALEVRATPGHTDGCLTFVLDDHSLAFTGDALLVRGCGRCDFQQGNAHTLYRSITEQILSLPDSCLLYPSHDYSGRTLSSVSEERAFNARLGGEADERDFVGYMENLELPHPRRLAVALPANLRSGRPRGHTPPDPDGWAPIRRSYAGLPQLESQWVSEHRDSLTLLDVRSADEFNGPDGHIPGSLLIPLQDLEQRLGEIPTGQPLVVLCHSGSRSALATQELLKAGRSQVANLRGGLRAWQREGLPLEHPMPTPAQPTP
ncbi:MBL fold metallo-hydrolase [Synechococcus sp. BSF8S]|uniref:rhodanese-like domain-containing protein n=1 Tax=Synechococcales TaxID=1890424 RepID=UPI001624B1E2|nr:MULTISPECIES: MBL fold metallo-hydrolase [unclassified Synechococcus]MBC1261992.1 MBL fold metallo-hydrolase [Synechococcus sp. BSF8S]MBC1264919.1 MBL fold metallo-hydrolase [Synechococcus sp. BSA11S]